MLSTYRHFRFKVLPLFLFTILSGCNPKPPACGDEQTQSALRSTLVEQTQKIVANMQPGAETSGQAGFKSYFSGLVIGFSNITSDGYDSNAKKYSCHAQVTFNGNNFPNESILPIDYHTQSTEDSASQKWVLQLDGKPELVNVLVKEAIKNLEAQNKASKLKTIEIAPSDAVYFEKENTGKDTTPIRIATRFGTLSVSTEDKLLLNGRPTVPQLDGNNDLTLLDTKSVGDQDIVLIKNTGGSGCPATFYFVQLSKTGLSISKEFGTCSDAYHLNQTGNSLNVTMPGFLGPFEPEQNRSAAEKQKHTFTLDNGILSENGKPL